MINIANFSMPIGESAYCTSLIDFSVEVTDPTYAITTSGTYFTVNDSIVATTLTSIPLGYRLEYSTVPSGSILLGVHGSNSNYDTEELYYDLRYGYEASWEKVVYWPSSTEVPISVVATNTAVKNNTAHFSTFFTTRRSLNVDLMATISAEGSGTKDLYSTIYPQGKYFMYGHTYSITISGVKDFSGNIMPEITYSFTIEELA